MMEPAGDLTQSEFDPEALGSRCDGDPELEADLLGTFLETAPSDLGAVRAGLSTGDLPAASAAAHSLKGMSLTLGAGGLGNLAGALEHRCREGDAAAAAELCAQVERAYARLEPALRLRLTGHRPETV